MDIACIFEQNTIINELTQGLELAKQLQINLHSSSSPAETEILLQKILSSYDKALLTLQWQPRAESPPIASLPEQPESSISIDESPRSGDFDQKVNPKKRKALASWSDQVRICTDNGLEGNTDDGYCWRKYGQKDILGAKFPRSYYRCTYRNVQNCMARKQVQRTDEDPTVFEVKYRGKHTCNQAVQSVPPLPPSPEKLETNQNHHHQPPPSGEILSNLKANLRVNTEELDAIAPYSFSFPPTSFGYIENILNNQQFNYPNQYSPSFISPATSTSNYLTEWGNDWQQQNDSNLKENIPAAASVTNSPLAFSTDMADLDPNFPFDKCFFSNDLY